jgi:ribosomal protein L37E
MFHPLQRAKNRFQPDYVLVVECRRCGTPVESETQSCSCCGSESIARYEIR